MKKQRSIQEIKKEAKEIAREIIQLRKRPDFDELINKGLKALS